MGCLTVCIKKIKEACTVVADIVEDCIVAASLLEHIKVKVTDIVFPVKVYAEPNCHIMVNTSHSKVLKVSTGLVCTINDIDENEMWWCDYWRVLWNNGVKALWVN